MQEATILSYLKRLNGSSKWGIRFENACCWIKCPFHGNGRESTPSLKINTNPSRGFFVGQWYCFGCAKTGFWNHIAPRLGLPHDDLPDDDIYINSLSKEELQGILCETEENVTNLWPSNMAWRGISGELVSKLGGTCLLRRQEMMLHLPVYMYGEKLGGIDCKIIRKDRSEQAYLNTPGRWTGKALFCHDYCQTLPSFEKMLFLTEGPRDCLSCLQADIPAVSILGTGNWNEHKAEAIIGMVPETCTVILAFDNDEAGMKANKKAAKDLKGYCRLLKLKYPEGKKDCADFTIKELKKLRKKLE